MFTQASHVRDFLVGGKAVLTIRSQKTGDHFTYRITKKEERSRTTYFVGLLSGGAMFDYLGLLQIGPVGNRTAANLKLTAKSCAAVGAPSIDAINYLLHHIYFNDRMPPKAEVYHDGRCCVCSRPLTHPTSITLGIGPECGAEQHARFEAVIVDNVVPLNRKQA
jgi:hypothetical protein